jgi:hypothetical protein
MRTLVLLLALLWLPAHAITLDAWIASYGLTGGNAADDADPDKDGMPNIIEYVLHGGVPNVSGPYDILPVFGWSMMLADGTFSESQAEAINGAPIGVHMALKYKLRSGIEGVKVEPLLSIPCPASNVDKSLFHYFGGQSMTRVMAASSGYTQAVCLMRSDLLDKGFMKLDVTRGEMPPVIGTAQPTLALDVGAVSYVARTVGTQSTTTVTAFDATYSQVSSPVQVQDVNWPWGLGSSGLDLEDVTRGSSATGVLIPTEGNLSRWTFVAPGSASIRIITPDRTYERLVNVTTSSSVISRTQSTSVAGSLRAHCDSQIDTRIAAHNAIAERARLFLELDPETPAYERNDSCWLNSVDMTPLAAWNSRGGFQRGPTLVSPRHFVGAVHWGLQSGDTVHFVKADNTVVVRTVSSVATISGTDILVGMLNSDVDAGIAFARVLPTSWAQKLPTLHLFGLPVCSADQGKQVYCRNLRSLSDSVVCEVPNVFSRVSYYKEAISGDSGSPCFALIADKMVLLCCWLTGGGGSGPSLTRYTTEINAAMATLGGGYSLTAVDLSSYTTF